MRADPTGSMTPTRLAAELDVTPKAIRTWLRARYGAPAGGRWRLSAAQASAARAHFGSRALGPAAGRATGRPRSPSRSQSDEAYVLDLCDEILGEKSLRQHRFAWLRGDPGSRGQGIALPVDGYYPEHELVVEYRELQHRASVPHFDKPDKLTISGVDRGEQRRRYDHRRESLIPARGLTLVIVNSDQLAVNARDRLLRVPETDRPVLAALLADADRSAEAMPQAQRPDTTPDR